MLYCLKASLAVMTTRSCFYHRIPSYIVFLLAKASRVQKCHLSPMSPLTCRLSPPSTSLRCHQCRHPPPLTPRHLSPIILIPPRPPRPRPPCLFHLHSRCFQCKQIVICVDIWDLIYSLPSPSQHKFTNLSMFFRGFLMISNTQKRLPDLLVATMMMMTRIITMTTKIMTR